MLNNRILRFRLVFRTAIIVIAWPQIVKIGAQRETEHNGIAPLIAQVNVGPIGHTVNGADVKLALLLYLAGEILGVVVSLILQFQTQRLPWRLVFDATEKRRRAMKHLTRLHRTSFVVTIISYAVSVAV